MSDFPHSVSGSGHVPFAASVFTEGEQGCLGGRPSWKCRFDVLLKQLACKSCFDGKPMEVISYLMWHMVALNFHASP